MGKKSAGTLLYRNNNGTYEVLIVHPSGSFNKNKAWSIPKGNLMYRETNEDAAIRETLEETGVKVNIPLIDLGSVKYKSGKKVYAFCGEQNSEPKCASWEIDQAEYVSLDIARERLHEAQKEFIDRLELILQNSI